MKRAENCVNAKIAHIRFEEDSLLFEFAKSKNHQDGEEHLGPWHLYANPKQPWLCPVLALAKYLLTYPESLCGNKPLFEGKDQYSHYCKIFSEVLKKNEEDLNLLGVEIGDLGSHSNRKGVATMVAGGCTCSPPIISICLRAGWVMGGVKDRYLKYASAGDQYVGRCANCSDQNTKEFALSPPYFDFTSIESDAERVARKKEVDDFVSERLYEVNDDEASDSHVKHLAKMLFASVCHHYKYLDENLHTNCLFRNSSFFKNIPQSILSCARTAFPWTATDDTPYFSGIPPHVIQLAEIEKLSQKIDNLRDTIKNLFQTELDERGVGSPEFYTTKIMERLSSLQSDITKRLDNAPIFNSLAMTNNISNQDGQNFHILEDEEGIGGRIDELDQLADGKEIEELRNLRRKRRRETAEGAVKKRRFKLGIVDGNVTSLPPDFIFKHNMSCEQVVTCWFIGDVKGNIMEYRRLAAKDVKHVPGGTHTRQKMQRFMAVIEKYARHEKCWIEKSCDCTVRNVNTLWKKVSKYVWQLYGSQVDSRLRTGAWRTMLEKMIRKGAFKKTRAEEAPDNEKWKLSVYNAEVPSL